MPNSIPIVEPAFVPDIFVAKLVRVEPIPGGCSRYVWATPCVGMDGSVELVICAKFICPDENLADAISMCLRARGIFSVVEILPEEVDGDPTAH